MDKTVEQLEALKEQHGSLEKVAEILRSHAGFENTSRATVHYWLQQKGVQPSSRAVLAVKILQAKQKGTNLTIAQPNSIWALPSILITWVRKKGDNPIYGQLKELKGVKAEVDWTSTGGEALRLLNRGKVDLAIGARSLLRECQNCSALCTLSFAGTTGIAKTAIESLEGIENKRFAYPAMSAVGDELMAWCEKVGVNVILEPRKVDRLAAAYSEKNIDGVVAWEPIISQVKRRVGDQNSEIPINEIGLHLLGGRIEMCLAVNTKSLTSPDAVRKYLWCLCEAINYVEDNKGNKQFQEELLAWFKESDRVNAAVQNSGLELDEADIEAALRSCKFKIDKPDLHTILTVWERDVSHDD